MKIKRIKKRAGRRRSAVRVSLPKIKLSGDHGTGTLAATAGTELVPLVDEKGSNPNNIGRRQRISIINRMLRDGKLTQRQYQAAEAIQIAYERVQALQGSIQIRERVDASPRPDAAITMQVERISRLAHVTKPIRRRDRFIVEHVCCHNKPLGQLRAIGGPRGYQRLTDNLERVADFLRF